MVSGTGVGRRAVAAVLFGTLVIRRARSGSAGNTCEATSGRPTSRVWVPPTPRPRSRRAAVADIRAVRRGSQADGMPGDELMTEAAARVVLDQLSTPLARQGFWRKFVLGDSFQEIANDLPGIKDAKAAENLVFRERRRLQKK